MSDRRYQINFLAKLRVYLYLKLFLSRAAVLHITYIRDRPSISRPNKVRCVQNYLTSVRFPRIASKTRSPLINSLYQQIDGPGFYVTRDIENNPALCHAFRHLDEIHQCSIVITLVLIQPWIPLDISLGQHLATDAGKGLT